MLAVEYNVISTNYKQMSNNDAKDCLYVFIQFLYILLYLFIVVFLDFYKTAFNQSFNLFNQNTSFK